MEDIKAIRADFASFKAVCAQAGIDPTLIEEAQKDVDSSSTKVSRLLSLYRALSTSSPALWQLWRSNGKGATAQPPTGPAASSGGPLRAQPSMSSERSGGSGAAASEVIASADDMKSVRSAGVTRTESFSTSNDAEDLAGCMRSPRSQGGMLSSWDRRNPKQTSPPSATMRQSTESVTTEIQDILEDLPAIGGLEWESWDPAKLMRQVERLISDATCDQRGAPSSHTLVSSSSSSTNGDLSSDADMLVVGAEEELAASFPAVWKEAEHVGLVPKAKVVEVQQQLRRAIERARKLEVTSKKATSVVQVLYPILARLAMQVTRARGDLQRIRRDASEDEKRAQANFHSMMKTMEESLRADIRHKDEVISELQSGLSEMRASNEALKSRLYKEESRARDTESVRKHSEASGEELRRQLSEAQLAAERYRGELVDATARLKGLEAEKAERGKYDSADLQAVVELTDALQKIKGEKEVLKAALEVRDARCRKLEAALQELRAKVLVEGAEEPMPEGRRRSLVAQAEGREAAARELADLRAALGRLREDAGRKVAVLAADMEALRSAAGRMAEELAEAKERYRKESRLRRRYFNEVIELKGSIRVFCRVRPLLPDETGVVGQQGTVAFPADNELEMLALNPAAGASGLKRFEFDRVFPPSAPQAMVFEDTQPLVASVMDGYNVCIFAYGQTGSGKTYTMEGPPSDRGVNMRALQELFALRRARSSEYSYGFRVSILEIYNEQIYDLLLPEEAAAGAPKLEIRQGAAGNYVPDLTEVVVRDLAEVEAVMRAGAENRTTHATSMNEHSSRSHCVMQVQVEATNLVTGVKTLSKLNLIDLAGSERVSRSEATGDRLKEAQNINRSLSALGDVISALFQKSAHVPYRNSKLTFLLADSLGGESKTLMFVQVTPAVASLQESLCSLNFAQRAKCVELGQGKKVDPAEFNKAKAAAAKAKEDAKAFQERMRDAEARAAALQKDLDARNRSLLDSSTALHAERADAAEQREALSGALEEERGRAARLQAQLAAAQQAAAAAQQQLAAARQQAAAAQAAAAAAQQQAAAAQRQAAAAQQAAAAAGHGPRAAAAEETPGPLPTPLPALDLALEVPDTAAWEVPSLLGGGIAETAEGDEGEGGGSRPPSRGGSVPPTPTRQGPLHGAPHASPALKPRSPATPLARPRAAPAPARTTPLPSKAARPSSSTDFRPPRVSRIGSADPLDLARSLDAAASGEEPSSAPGSRSSSAGRSGRTAAASRAATIGTARGEQLLAQARARKAVSFDHPDSPLVDGVRTRKSKVHALIAAAASENDLSAAASAAAARPGYAAGRTPPSRRPLAASFSGAFTTPRSRSATNLLAASSPFTSTAPPLGLGIPVAPAQAAASSLPRPGSAHPSAPASLTQPPSRRAVTPTGTSSSAAAASALAGPAARVAGRPAAGARARPPPATTTGSWRC